MKLFVLPILMLQGPKKKELMRQELMRLIIQLKVLPVAMRAARLR